MNDTREIARDDDRVWQRGMSAIFRPRQLRDAVGFSAFVVAFYFGYRYGMSFSQAAASPFWFPDSILLCALLVSPPRRWWIFVLAPLPIRLFSEVAAGIPYWFLLVTFALDSAKGLLAALALRWCISNPARLESVREYSLFFLIAVLLIPAAVAFGGAAVRSLLSHDFWAAWRQWFLGDALAQLIVTPAILYWIFGAPWKAAAHNVKRWVEGGLLATGLIVTG